MYAIRALFPSLVSLFVVGACATASLAHGAADANKGWVDPGWRRTVTRYHVSFDEQGLSTTTFEFEIKALNDRGAATIAEQTFRYNSYFSGLTASELATVKADGRVIPVDERAIKDQPQSTSTSSPYFDERREEIVTYSDVAAGDTVKGRLVFNGKRAPFPGEFADYWTQNLNEPPERMELTVDGPASKPLQIAAHDVEQTEERIGNRILHHAIFIQTDPRPLNDVIDGFDNARRFEVSTFKDYAAFAAAMNARNAPTAVPDEAVRRVAASVIGDAATTRTKAERLANWVAQNIRYVGIGLEDGGWTSQPASTTLSLRYGDCKAHATLLKALLAAEGIEANLVTVNLSSKYTLTELATPNFDHAIVYLPGLDLYVDPTSSTTAFGALPAHLYGKPVLNIDKGVLSTTPVLKPEQFALRSQTSYVLRADGTRQAKGEASGTGVGASYLRYLARYAETRNQEELAKQRLGIAGVEGSGAYDFANPRELSDNFAMRATFELTKPVGLTEPTLLRLSPLDDRTSSLWNLVATEDRGGAFACSSLDYSESVSLTPPAGIHIYEIPGPLAFKRTIVGRTGYGFVTASVEINGAVAFDGPAPRADSHVRIAFDSPVCPADFEPQIRRWLQNYDAFRMGAVGLTPRLVSHVDVSGSEYMQGVTAYRAKNYALALTKLLPAAADGDAAAADFVARMYFDGKGVPQDYHQAVFWYTKAAEAGDDVGEYDLARMYANGSGVDVDNARAVDLYLKAAAQGYAYAEYNLGFMYHHGQGVTQDYREALQWYSKAAGHGNLEAQTALGVMYDEGVGVAQDFQQAAQWYRQAADKSYPSAELRLGLLFLSGHGVAMDQKQAVDLFRKAADTGFAPAEFDLGDAYEKGLGVPQDKQQAMEWYSQAANQGHIAAQSRLDALRNPRRADSGVWSYLAHVLSP